jgi:hypothetical protein
MTINNPVAVKLDNLQTLEKLGENNGHLTFNGAIVGVGGSSGRAEFQINSLPYTWNSAFGELTKQDILAFPLLATLVKISCNFPVRLRLYRSLEARELDLRRPPCVSPKSGLLLEAMLGGASEEAQLKLAPFCLIAGLLQAPIILEKLSPNAGIINLSIDLVK